MFNEPRNWKWMVPAFVAWLFTILAMTYWQDADPNLNLVGWICVGVAAILWIWAAMNSWN